MREVPDQRVEIIRSIEEKRMTGVFVDFDFCEIRSALPTQGSGLIAQTGGDRIEDRPWS